MITAAEARKISGPRADDFIKEIEAAILKAAEGGETEVIIRSEPYAYWLYDEKKLGEQERLAVEQIRKAGYQVTLLYQENQFVDIGLWIRW